MTPTTPLEERLRSALRVMGASVNAGPPGIAEQAIERATERHRTRLAVMGAALAIVAVTVIPLAVVHAERSGPAAAEQEPADSSARALLDLVPPPPDAHRVMNAPAVALRHPTQDLGEGVKPLRVSRWYTVDRPWAGVWAWALNQRPTGLRSQGTETGSVFSAWLEPSALPHRFLAAEVGISVIPLSTHRTGMAEFALVYPARPRIAAERVPTSGVRAVVTAHGSGFAAPPVSLSPAASAALAHAFDLLHVATGMHSCPPLYGDTLVIRFSAHGHVWRAALDGCFAVGVQLDGKPLPGLDSSSAFTRLLRSDGFSIPT